MEEAVVNLTLEEFKETVLLLLDITKCAVCLKSVGHEVVQCVNSHLVCSDCKANLKICPKCCEKFSQSKPSHFVSQVIDILPTSCKYRNCQTIMRNIDDHEKYCGFKPTNCKWCSWKGPGKDIFNHCNNVHGCRLKPNGEFHHYLPINIEQSYFLIRMVEFKLQSQFFWEETLNDPVTKMFTIKWHMVPNGKPTCDHFITLTFKSKSGLFNATKIKLNLDPDGPSEDNSIPVPHRILSHFIDERNCLASSVIMSLN